MVVKISPQPPSSSPSRPRNHIAVVPSDPAFPTSTLAHAPPSDSFLLQIRVQTRRGIARLGRCELASRLCLSALRTLRTVLLNATVSISVSWLLALSISQGNVLSGRSPSAQSPRSFLMGVLLWVHVWFCGAVCTTRSVSLFHLALASRPDHAMGVLHSLRRMAQRTASWFVVSGLFVAATGFSFGSLDDSYRPYRLEMYVGACWYFTFVRVADKAARRIYREETVQGRQRQARPRDIPPPPHHQHTAKASRLARGPRQSRLVRFFRGIVANSALLLSVVVPAVYVHIISFVGVISSTTSVWLFTIASLSLKVVLQEIAKLHIMRDEIQSARAMAVLVALPTVFVDTQVRIVLLRSQDALTTLSTTVALAGAEICVRLTKTWLVHWQLRHHANGGAAGSERTLEQWKAQLRRYHAVEVSADMYAEYLAIGCSSVILVTLGRHPHYLFYIPTASQSTWVSAAFQLLAQIAVEVVVDVVSCMVELASGITFAHVDRERGYFLALCITLAIININTSAILYLTY